MRSITKEINGNEKEINAKLEGRVTVSIVIAREC